MNLRMCRKFQGTFSLVNLGKNSRIFATVWCNGFQLGLHICDRRSCFVKKNRRQKSYDTVPVMSGRNTLHIPQWWCS